jgi:hypothetical protein
MRSTQPPELESAPDPDVPIDRQVGGASLESAKASVGLALDRDSSHGQEVDMRDHDDEAGSVPELQGRHAGCHTTFARPTVARIRARRGTLTNLGS